MKVAISATGDTVESSVDNRFGRCSYFAIFDTDTHNVKFITNTAAESSQGAGPAAVQLLAGNQVQQVVSGEFGMKVKPLLEQLSIKMLNLQNGQHTILDVLKQFK